MKIVIVLMILYNQGYRENVYLLDHEFKNQHECVQFMFSDEFIEEEKTYWKSGVRQVMKGCRQKPREEVSA